MSCFYHCRADDAYAIYAALHSGPKTFIATRDEFKDHLHLLGDMGHSFRRWQRLHQIIPNGKEISSQKIILELQVNILLWIPMKF